MSRFNVGDTVIFTDLHLLTFEVIFKGEAINFKGMAVIEAGGLTIRVLLSSLSAAPPTTLNLVDVRVDAIGDTLFMVNLEEGYQLVSQANNNRYCNELISRAEVGYTSALNVKALKHELSKIDSFLKLTE